jgi:hypothetical protein
MSKQINVNPNFYKTGGREPAEGADAGDSGNVPNVHLGKGKRRTQQELPGHKKENIKKK